MIRGNASSPISSANLSVPAQHAWLANRDRAVKLLCFCGHLSFLVEIHRTQEMHPVACVVGCMQKNEFTYKKNYARPPATGASTLCLSEIIGF